MGNFFILWVIFMISSYTLIIIDYLKVSPENIQHAITILIALLLIFLNVLPVPKLKRVFSGWTKWFFLFIVNLVVQLVIVTTGGLYSPFLILIHLSTIGVSLLFSFYAACIFLVFSLANMASNMMQNPIVLQRFSQDPAVLFIVCASFIAIVPLSKLLSDTYHLQTMLIETLNKKLQLQETLLAKVQELILITDLNLNILSVNYAVERTLRRPRSDLLQKNFFDVIFLRDRRGNLISKDTFNTHEFTQSVKPLLVHDLSFLATVESMKKVALQIQPIIGPDGSVDQLSFVIIDMNRLQTLSQDQNTGIEETRIKHEALIEDLKQKLVSNKLYDFAARFLFITKTEHDIFTFRSIEDHGITQDKLLIDIALTTKEITQQEQEFAHVLQVILEFNLGDFDAKSTFPNAISPTILPGQPTGPFFSASCDVKYLEILIQKLLEISILLSSGIPNSHVNLRVEQNSSSILIKITANCPTDVLQNLDAIFLQHYGVLKDKTNLRLGSGLEGFLAKTIADTMHIPIEAASNNSTPPSFMLALKIPK